MRLSHRLVLSTIIVMSLCHPATVRSEVVDSTAHGFTVKTVVTIAADEAKVYHDLVANVGVWWDPAHTYSHNARNLSITDKAGGCFCEKLKDGGSVQHMRVVFAEPGKALRMHGGLGPLQALAVDGSLTWELKKSGKGTELTVTYAVGGYRPGGLAALAAPVDNVLREQVMRLQKFIETGKPE